MIINCKLKYRAIRVHRVINFFFLPAFVLFLSAVLCSCSSDINNQKGKKEAQLTSLESKMFGDEDPSNHITAIREYLFENYPSMPKNIKALIIKQVPKIHQDNINLEYIFSWTLPDHRILNVYTMPPPLCDVLNVKIVE